MPGKDETSAELLLENWILSAVSAIAFGDGGLASGFWLALITMRIIVIYCMFLAASMLYAQPLAQNLPDLKQPSIPAPPIYSGDGAVVIFSSQAQKNYRGPILIFVNRTRLLFQNGLNLQLGSNKCPLEIRVGDKRDGDKSVITSRVRDVNGQLRERIVMPDPEAADLGLFRRAVAVAFLRAWMVEDGGTDETMKDLPSWLIDGLMRYLDGTLRQTDLDRTYLLWSSGCLPPADELYKFDSYAARKEPAVASVLTGWFLEKRGYAFKTLLKKVAHGFEWSPEKVAELLAEDFHGDFDRMLDMRLYELGRRVIEPGLTTAGIVRRFRSELLLFPSDYGMMFSKTNCCYSLREAVDSADFPEIREAALDKSIKIRTVAAGRDGSLLALSEQYARFLRALADNEKHQALLSMLRQAEAMRLDLENSIVDNDALKK